MRSVKRLFLISLLMWSIGSTPSIYGQTLKEEPKDKMITLSVAGDATLGYYYGQSN